MKTRKTMNEVLFIVFFTLITLSFIGGFLFVFVDNISYDRYDIYFTLNNIDWCTTCTMILSALSLITVTAVMVYNNISWVIEGIEEIKKIRKEIL